MKYPIPEIPDDSENKLGTNWVLPKIIGSGRVSGTRQALLGRVVNISLHPKSSVDDHHNHNKCSKAKFKSLWKQYKTNWNRHNDDDNDDSSHLLRELCAVMKDCESFEAPALAPPDYQHHCNHCCGDDDNNGDSDGNGDDDDNGDGNDDNDAQDDDGDEDARPELRSTWLKCQRQ